MKRLLLAILLLWLLTLFVPPLRDRTAPYKEATWAWTWERLEGPLSPFTNRYRRVRAEAELDQTVRLMVIQRNQGQRVPEPEALADFMTRHDVAAGGIDPWGTPYMMVQEADSMAIISAGPDGLYETDDDLVARVAHHRGPARR